MIHVSSIPLSIQFLISGGLLGAGFVYSFMWPLVLLGIWVLITALEQTTSWYARCGGVVVAFSLKSLCGIAWFWSVYPIEWLSIPVSAWQLPAIGLGWFVSGLSLGIGGVLLGLVVGLTHRYLSSVPIRYLLYSLGWVGAEVLGSLLFSLVTYGEGGTITTAFSFGYIGYVSASLEPLFFFASVGGVYGVTVMTVFIVLICGYGISRLTGVRRGLLSGFLVGSIALSLIVSEDDRVPVVSHGTTTTVAIVDTNFKATLGSRVGGAVIRQRALIEALQSARASGAEYIIFPEDSGLMRGDDSERSFAALTYLQQLETDGVVVIDSGSIPTPAGILLRATILDGKQVTQHVLDKQYLVPVGEFVPSYVITPLFTALGWGSVFAALERSVGYRPGPFDRLSADLTHIPGILFCFEGVDPRSVEKLRVRNVPFIAHPFSHGWFQSTSLLTPQLTMMLRLQARANAISIVSAGNQGVGAVYLPSGDRYIPQLYAKGALWEVRVAEIPTRS